MTSVNFVFIESVGAAYGCFASRHLPNEFAKGARISEEQDVTTQKMQENSSFPFSVKSSKRITRTAGVGCLQGQPQCRPVLFSEPMIDPNQCTRSSSKQKVLIMKAESL